MKRNLLWFLLCNAIFVFSTFLHECAHGLQSYLMGYSVSTGFNRIGNVYKFPNDIDFRTGFSITPSIDAAVILTLIVAIVFTVLFFKSHTQSRRTHTLFLAFACCNAIMRLVPSLLSLILPVFGINHIEDEIDMGQVWISFTGLPLIKYLPALLSVVVSLVCIGALFKVGRRKKPLYKYREIFSIAVFAFLTSFFIENLLDGIIRINWVVK